MKNLLTLFLTALTALSFAQQTASFPHQQARTFKMARNTAMPHLSQHSGSVARSSDSCNTQDILDYNTYNELVANNLQINYNGSWNTSPPAPRASYLTSSFVTVASSDSQAVSYAMAAFDSIAFANYANATMYSKLRKASTITLDTIYTFIGVSADDTSTTGDLVNDSLVFTIYPISATGLISTTAATTVTFAGHDGLARFVTGTAANELFLARFPVGYTFGAGLGFAVKVNFYSGDNFTSHCLLSYGYADSCQTITISGQQYASPAYPSPFIATAKNSTNLVGNTFYGEIDSTGANVASVVDVSNGTYGYNIPGVPANCSHLYIENWQILAGVTVNSTLGVSIADSVYTIPCSGGSHAVVTTRTGDLANATYSWSAGVYGSQTTANTSIYNPGIYSVTVTNSQGCTATAQIDATYPGGLSQTPSFSFPSEICKGTATSFTNTSSDITGYTSIWTFGQGGSQSTNTNPSFNYTAAGTYTVSLVMDSAGCEFATSQSISVLDCTGFSTVGFDNNVNIKPNPSNGNVNISITDAEKNVTITVYNIIGETVKALATTESSSVFNQNLDLSNLSNGTYLVKVQSGNNVTTKKLVITK